MPEKVNQHFVPQGYFKLFTHGRSNINLILMKSGKIVFDAAVRKQCTRHKFYGNTDIENSFAQWESQIIRTLRRFIEVAYKGDASSLQIPDFGELIRGITFQRARTKLEVDKQSPSHEKLLQEMVLLKLKNSPDVKNREEMVSALESGSIEIKGNPTAHVLKQILVYMESAPLLSDLRIVILRNRTDFPFLFSDSPVVMYNSYLYNVKERGVLGFQTPGLQIFYPLNSRVAVMCVDRLVYRVSYTTSRFCDIYSRQDISHINALQLHHSQNAVYFADRVFADYAVEMWKTHSPLVVKPVSNFRKLPKEWLLDGKPKDGNVYHSFEPQLNHKLKLSFINCDPINERDFKFSRRSPELDAEHSLRHPLSGSS